jgi:two-component system, cell cycle sensor histidine kinase and response regulator CckA
MRQGREPASPLWQKAAVAATLLALLAGGFWFFQVQRGQQRKEVEERLGAIAELKADQIADWREERLADANVFSQQPGLVESVRRFLASPTDQEASEILSRLRPIQERYHYADIFLVDPELRVRLSLSGKTDFCQEYAPAFEAAAAGHEPVWTPLHIGPAYPFPHVSVVAPLFAGPESPEPLGALVLVCDAAHFLYPLIQSWPTPSQSAETLLVRRDGEDVIFLNELRHQKDTALKLRVPLSRVDLPAAMAAQGRKGIVEGRDYRGVEVVAALLPIPGSPWFLVAKEDADEAFADWRFRSALILALVLGTAALAGLAGLVGRQRSLKAHYRALYRSEAALRTTLERHHVTLHAIGDAVIATDARGLVELLNPVAVALTGWKAAEALGRPLEEVFRIVNEQTREPVEDPVAKVLRQGAVVNLANHTLLIARDGKEIPIADSGAPIRDDREDIVGVVLVFRDQSEERLRQRLTETRLSLIAYASDHTLDELLTWTLDRVGGILESPIGFYHFVEPDQRTVSLQQWSTRTLKEFCRAEGRGMRYDLGQAGVWADCVRQGKPVIHNDYASLAHKRGLPQGHAEVVRELVVPVMRQGRPAAILGVGNKPTDYTEKDVEIASLLADLTWEIIARKRVEQAQRDSEKRYRRLFESAKDGILILDADTGKVVDVNPFLLELLDYPYDELLGKHLWDIGSFHQVSASQESFKTLQDKEYVRYENLPLKTRDGRLVDVEFVSNVYQVDHTRVVQCNIRDITARRQAEEEKEKMQAQLTQAQKMESVGRLAGGVAHDFNNMLSVILGNTELAMEKAGPGDPLHAHIQEIRRAAMHSAEITRQLLAFARKQIIAPRVLDLNDTVEEMLKMLRRLIGEDIDLVWQPAPGLWRVRMDPSQIDQILTNLGVNARDAISGVGRVIIETQNVVFDKAYCADHPGFVPGEFALLAVSDDGCGMDRETQDKLFEPFFTTKGVGQGTGLGLSTVLGIVKQNDGFLNVYSESGKGTVFKVYLPRHAGEAEKIGAASATETPAGRGETVLVVEDAPQILEMVTIMLEGFGYRVLAAGAPSEALKIAGRHAGEIQLLITDVIMPEMNGQDLAARLKTLCPKIQIVFMSGYTADAIAHRGVLDNNVHFIQKPFFRKELATILRAALDGK